MADVALVSVISSGIVGVLGATLAGGGAYYAQRVALKLDELKRLESRRDDLLDVLDDAAKTAVAVHRPMTTKPRTFGALAAFTSEIHGEARTHLARLAVRAGPTSALYLEYERFAQALRTMHRVADAESPDAVVEHVLQQFPAEVAEMDAAVVDFLKAAKEAANLDAARIQTGAT